MGSLVSTSHTAMKLFLSLLCGLGAASAYNDEYIQKLNSLIPNKQWVAGKNRFESMDDVIPLLGAWKDTRSEEEKSYRPGSFEAAENYQAPESFDSREEWSSCNSISTVWDQANCGSCWAVGASGAISDRICIHKGTQTMVSAQQLTTCCHGIFNGGCGQGCNGGYLLQAWEYWKNTGLVSGGGYGADTCQPYSLPKCDHHVEGPYGPCPASVRTPACHHECTNDDYNMSFEEDKHYGRDTYDVRRSEQHIMEEIQTNGPVEAAFTVYEDFPSYRSGVYEHTHGGALGGHAIRIIGWGVEEGKKYWLVANSWNEGWGDQGLFKILKGSDECGIEGNVVAGMPR